MAIVTYILREDAPLTEEQKAEIEFIRNMRDEDIVFDEDCPELIEGQLRQFKRVNPRRKKAAS